MPKERGACVFAENPARYPGGPSRPETRMNRAEWPTRATRSVGARAEVGDCAARVLADVAPVCACEFRRVRRLRGRQAPLRNTWPGDFIDRSVVELRAMEEWCDRAACRLCGNAQVGTKIGGLNRSAYELYTELARWGDTGDRSSSRLGGRKVRTPRARTLDNIQAERSDTSTTENKPPMAAVGDLGFFRRLR